MGVLDSFKQDAFLSSQTVQVGNNQTPKQWAAEGHYPGKRTGSHLSGEQRESCCSWEAKEEAEGVPWGWPGCSVCAETTSDIFILCCFHFICNKFTQARKGGRHVPIPPHRLWQGLDDEEPFQAGQWTEHCLDSLMLLRPWSQSRFPGLEDCSPRTLFIFAELLRWVPVKKKAHSLSKQIWSHLTKICIAWTQRSWLRAAKPKERNKEWGSNYFLPTLCLINSFSSLAAQFIFDDCPRRQLQKSNT